MPIYKDKAKTKDGRQYYFTVSYVLPNGKQMRYKSKRFITKKEAEQEEALFIINNVNSKTNVNSITFNQLIDVCLKEKQKALKPQSYRKVVNIFSYIDAQLGNVEVANMNKQDYECFRNWIDSQNWTTLYKNKVHNYLKTLLYYADKKFDIVNRVPFKYEPFSNPTEPIKKMQFFTYDEFKRFINVIPAEDIIYNGLFTLLFYCGLRIGEANSLTFADVCFDEDRPTIDINKTVSTKFKGTHSKYLILPPKTKGSVRILPLPKVVLERIKTLRDYYSKFEGYSDEWFVFGGLNPIAETTITKAKEKYIKKAQLKHIRLHDFRHSCASYYIHLNCTPSVLSKLLGHSSTKMTLDTYSHFYESDLTSLINKVNELESI